MHIDAFVSLWRELLICFLLKRFRNLVLYCLVMYSAVDALVFRMIAGDRGPILPGSQLTMDTGRSEDSQNPKISKVQPKI